MGFVGYVWIFIMGYLVGDIVFHQKNTNEKHIAPVLVGCCQFLSFLWTPNKPKNDAIKCFQNGIYHRLFVLQWFYIFPAFSYYVICIYIYNPFHAILVAPQNNGGCRELDHIFGTIKWCLRLGDDSNDRSMIYWNTWRYYVFRYKSLLGRFGGTSGWTSRGKHCFDLQNNPLNQSEMYGIGSTPLGQSGHWSER